MFPSNAALGRATLAADGDLWKMCWARFFHDPDSAFSASWLKWNKIVILTVAVDQNHFGKLKSNIDNWVITIILVSFVWTMTWKSGLVLKLMDYRALEFELCAL